MTPPVITKASSLVSHLLGREDHYCTEALYLKAALALSSARRETVFEDLTQSLCELLEADGALIGVHTDGSECTEINALALLFDGKWTRDFRYSVADSPCGAVIGKEFCYFASGVRKQFSHPALAQFDIDGYAGFPLLSADGHSLGLIAVMTHRPLRAPERVEALLRIFSDRVVVEIERARTEEALKASDELYGAVFRSALDGIAMLTVDGEIVDVNPALVKMSGYSRQEMIGRRIQDFVPDRDKVDAFYREVLAKSAACSEGQSSRKDGTPFFCEYRASVVQFRGGPHVLQIIRDISDRKRAEAHREALELQLKQSQRMEVIGQLTGGIAHDFNNILTGLLGYVDMAGERAEQYQDEKLQRYLARAGHAGSRARELIQQMLTFSRGKRGSPRAVNLATVTRDMISLLESSLPSSIVVNAVLPETLPSTTIDPIHFEQVLMNLCINARDAMTSHGTLSIELIERQYCECFCCASCKHAIDGAFVALSITDTGPGIPAEVLPRMFEPFYSTKELGKGSGMGLAIVHGIVHDYGGHLIVNTAAGSGTTIRVLLPLATEDANTPPSSKTRRSDATTGTPLSGRVLLVDDDDSVAEYMQELLESWGLDVTVYRDSLRAREFFERHPHDFCFALLDQTMPQLTGIELARELLASVPSLPIVLYTGYSDTINEDMVRDVGIKALVKKPIDKRNFRRIVESVMAAERPTTGVTID